MEYWRGVLEYWRGILYFKDGSECGGFEVCKSGVWVENYVVLVGSIKVECVGGVFDGFFSNSDFCDVGVIECRVYLIV